MPNPAQAPHLSLANALASLREDIQAEDTLIASRVTWYVTSQAFFLTAYATSWNAGFGWPSFFHHILPIAALLISIVLLASIFAATWAQDVYLREQMAAVAQIKEKWNLEPTDQLALAIYERTMVANRQTAQGRTVGGQVHALVRIAPLLLPIGFCALWLYTLLFAPGAIGLSTH